nr:hypothetical protein [Tanacetum cinerariifolium]
MVTFTKENEKQHPSPCEVKGIYTKRKKEALGSEVEELLKEGMLVSSSSYLLVVLWMRLVIWVCSQWRKRKCLWLMVSSFGNGSSSGCHGGLWWLIDDEEDGEVLEEEMARDAQRMNEQIARDAKIARIHAEEELQMMIDRLDRSNEMIAKHLQEYEQAAVELTIKEKIEQINELVKYQDHLASILKYKAEQSKPLFKKQQREFYMSVLRSHACWKTKHFKGMSLKEIREKFVPHFDREDLSQLWALVKETLNIRQATIDKEKELWVELKRLYEPDVEDQLWTQTQALMHDPVEWRLYDRCGVHHVLSRDQEIFMMVEKEYPLRKRLAIAMIINKLHVENYSQMANDLIQKIYKIANSPSQRSD